MSIKQFFSTSASMKKPVEDVIIINDDADIAAPQYLWRTFYEYHWSGVIVQPAQLNKSGLITKIEGYNENARVSNWTLRNTEIWMGELQSPTKEFNFAQERDFDSSSNDWSSNLLNWTKVWGSGSLGSTINLSYPSGGIGWANLVGSDSITPFNYSGNNPLVIQFRQRPGSYQSSSNDPDWAYKFEEDISGVSGRMASYESSGSQWSYTEEGNGYGLQVKMRFTIFG